MFREERMVEETRSVIERAVLPKGDYVSPGLRCVRLDSCFPNMKAANPKGMKWPYLRWEVPHNWYQDSRAPGTGFANRDEAHILYNTALRLPGAPGLGNWMLAGLVGVSPGTGGREPGRDRSGAGEHQLPRRGAGIT